MSADDYDDITAFHYEAYRPPLHASILKECLGDATFKHGLDIGCGTGKSTVALKSFCETVVGVDPNIDMLSKATPVPNIHYELFDGRLLNFEPNTFDLITLAGSWWYAKSKTLLNEIHRVSMNGAKIALYDFEVQFQSVYKTLGLTLPSAKDAYNHFADFSKFDNVGFELNRKKSEELKLSLTADKLAHLLCSEKKTLVVLKEKYGFPDTFEKVKDILRDSYDTNKIDVLTKTYSTKYYVKKEKNI
ncbi:class I SAM-dependent methyltransferase [Maribacter aestuarii]|uniref:class I SAM-dependent methyltransferase n=1 Tax=Maribacter aestuarii TaxID=1130723 RepID=UPI00248D1C57|nr:class I SAM-dependent methyltransferase [Maribacter aestuarii]